MGDLYVLAIPTQIVIDIAVAAWVHNRAVMNHLIQGMWLYYNQTYIKWSYKTGDLFKEVQFI
jgi:hypothetical protein